METDSQYHPRVFVWFLVAPPLSYRVAFAGPFTRRLRRRHVGEAARALHGRFCLGGAKLETATSDATFSEELYMWQSFRLLQTQTNRQLLEVANPNRSVCTADGRRAPVSASVIQIGRAHV